jgi:hypothetical protein
MRVPCVKNAPRGEITERRREDDAGDAGDCDGTQAQAAYDRGPEQIKLLLHGQGPKRTVTDAMSRGGKVGEIQEAQQEISPIQAAANAQIHQHRDIKRENAKHPPDVEVLPVVRTFARVDQNPGDEKSGEDEKQTD